MNAAAALQAAKANLAAAHANLSAAYAAAYAAADRGEDFDPLAETVTHLTREEEDAIDAAHAAVEAANAEYQSALYAAGQGVW